MTNVKKGDRAVIVDADPRNRKYIGCLLTVGDVAYVDVDGIVYWCFEAESPLLRRSRRKNLCDVYLRPIRDPGDDAKDETLSWKPVPRKELIPLKVRGEVRAE